MQQHQAQPQASSHSTSTDDQAPATQAASATSAVDLTSAQQPAPTAQAAAPAAPATELPPRYGVSLEHAVETVRQTVELGARVGGTTTAHIELSPPSLGTIRIQLQHTDDGVTAKVLTDHAATADTLSQGGDDLRRAFQSAGVNLLSLDIEARGDRGAQTQDPAPSSGSSRTSSGDDADIAGDLGAVEPITSSALTGSALVNVLA